jgi:hypothetical protein
VLSFQIEGRSCPVNQVEGGRFYHGSPSLLPDGTVLTPGRAPNFRQSPKNAVCITSDSSLAALWASKAAKATGRPRQFHVYEVELTGPAVVWRWAAVPLTGKVIIQELCVPSARILRRVPEFPRRTPISSS